MRVWAGALRAAGAVSGPGPGLGGFRERFDFGGRDVASWFPGHMAKGERWEWGRGLAPDSAAAHPALCCRPAADAGLPAARRLPHRGPRRSHILRHGSSSPPRVFPDAGTPPPALVCPLSPPPAACPVSLQAARSPTPVPLLPAPHQPHHPPGPTGPPSTCSHGSARSLSLAAPTSRCRAVTPCCRRRWASARTSWC